MVQQPAILEKTELIKLHAATCFSINQFISGHHYPKLAHLIVHQLGCLIAHPDLEPVSARRDMYQQLLEHWQQVMLYLLEPPTIRTTLKAPL